MKVVNRGVTREKVINFQSNPDLQTNNFDNEIIITLFVNQS